MTANKDQHWVSSSYLQAWSDPNKPELYEPFVHIFNRRGGEHRRKSPKNIFNMPDLYTIFAGGHATSALSNTSAGWNAISCACAS